MNEKRETSYRHSRLNSVAIELGETVQENHVIFHWEGDLETKVFHGKFLEKWAELSAEGSFQLLVGMGKESMEKTPMDKESGKIREICAAAAKEMKERKIREFSCDMGKIVHAWGEEALKEAAEGIVLGLYSVERLSDREDKSWKVTFTGAAESENARALIREGQVLSGAVIFARDMVNRPANYLRPEDFAAEITALMDGLPVETEILPTERLREEGMGAFLAVGESSAYPPCMLVLRYLPKKKQSEEKEFHADEAVTALVGKGVMCDTGGYCLKESQSMAGIKGDMAGGAAVAAAIYALAKNNAPNNVIGVIPMCENRIAPGSMIPGDVVKAGDGTLVEILNTDAEGRLILADAVSFAVRREQADRVVDIATLTGAMARMFGSSITGLMADDEEFCRELLEAAGRSGERFCRVSWYREHEKMIESDMADIKNVSSSCPAITAGLFIRHFAAGKPWLHLDIAGTADVSEPVFAYQEKRATGVGVMTLYELCRKQGKEER